MNFKKIKKAFALLTAVALLGTLGLPAMASGDEGLPDPTKPGSITIHKYALNNEPDEAGNGLEITDQDKLKELGEPLEGVGFTLYQVKESFDIKETTTPAEAKANATIVDAERFTDKDGLIVYSNLQSARYYVLEETTPPTTGQYRPMEMAIISVPYGYTGTQTGWNYDVHVYPKNVDIEEVTKEIEDEQPKYLVGDTVSWKISGRVNPELRDGTPGSYTYGYLKFTDALDERLDYTADSEAVKGIKKDGSTINLVKGDDYTAVYTAATNTVVYEITSKGIDKLLDGNAGRVDITFDTVVNSKAVSNDPGQTDIENDVEKEWSNHDGTEEKDAVPAEKPKAKLGYIDIMKIDSKIKTIKLDGAQFKIATSEANAKAKNFIKDKDGKDLVVTTGKDTRPGGEEHGFGIFVGLETSAAEDKDFYLVEVKAPNAPASNPDWEYVLRPDAIKVTILKANQGASATIENTRIGEDGPGPIFKLPMTGGSGTIAFIAAGIALIGVGIIALNKTKVKKAN